MYVKNLLKQSSKWRVLYLITLISTLTFFGVNAFDNYQPTVSSDKDDYAPGEIAVITGYGWTQDSMVHVEFKEEPDYPDYHVYDVSVGEDGSWTIKYQVEPRHVGVKFTVTAVGKQSGATAITVFTDANVRLTTNSGSSTLSYEVKNSTSCTGPTVSSGTRDASTNQGGSDAIAVTGAQSVKITAPLTNSLGQTFTGYTVSTSYTTPNTSQPNIICVVGTNNNGTIAVTANYATCTTPATPVVTVVNNCDGTSTLSTTASGSLLWSTGATTSSITVTSGGTYTVTSTVAGGCTSAPGSGIAAPKTAPSAPAVTVVDNCDGTSTLSTNATGALLWSTGAATSSITVTQAGAYTVTTTVNGCTSTAGSGTANPKTTPAKPTITAQTGTSACPGNTVVLTSSASTGNQWYRNGAAISGATNQSFTAIESGSYTVIVTANGCSSTASDATVVTIEDVTAPVKPTIAAATGECSVTVTAPTTTDNCAGTVTGTTSDPTEYTVQGEYTITWTFSDGNGNSTTATQEVIVRDVTLPLIAATEAVTVEADAGQCGATIAITAPEVTDNCEALPAMGTRSDGAALSAQYPVGTTTITWNAKDAAGNDAVAVTQTITVRDTQAPTITAPATVEVAANAQCQATEVALGTPTTADNCGVKTVTNNAPATFPLGDTEVIWTVTDVNGLTATATQVVTVVDMTAPVLTAAINQNVNLGENCTITIPDVRGTATDNCQGTTITQSPAVGTEVEATHNQTITVTVTATDAAGNTDEAQVVLTAKDVTNPTIAAPANVKVAANASCRATGVVLGSATASDNCAGVTVTNDAPESYPLGTTTVTWTATDAAGLKATVTQTVTVEDRTAPVAPTIAAATGECSVTVTTTPTAADNCKGTVTGTTSDPLTYTEQGTYTITWSFNDGNGNTSTATQQVIVKDATAPVTPTIADATGECSVTVTAPTTTDNCAGTVTGTTSDPLTYNEQGTYTITWTFNDGNGNGTTATQNVIVKDVTAPVIAATQPVTADADAGQCGATISITAPEVTDNCGAQPATGTRSDNLALNAQYPVGTTTITWNATDVNGNPATAVTQTVTVRDTQAPTITAPANVKVAANAQCEATDVALGTPITADNCKVASETNNAPATFPLGDTEVIWTVTDAAGLTATAKQVVTVVDETAPVVAAASNQTAGTDDGSCTVTLTIPDATVTDNCSVKQVTWAMTGATTASGAGQVGEYTFNQGVTTITYTATDKAGNSSSDVMTVTVTDDEAPVIKVPANIVVATQPDKCGAVVNYNVSTTDNCSSVTPTMTAGLAPGATFPVGTTTVTYTTEDKAGNSATESFTVTVTNNTPSNLVITGPASPVQLNSTVTLNASFTDENISTAVWTWGDGTNTTQTISGSPISATHTYTEAGVYSVGLTVTDHCGQSTSTVFDYVVIYDPNGGFVTGGGWIDSPPGAYVANPTLIGKANFGFIAKYKKGSNQVDGNTEFQFKAGDLNFKSSAHDAMSLVVAGYKAIYKGVGSINGNEEYAFMVSVEDGNLKGSQEADRFRIKIWNRRDGAIVYDNNVSLSDKGDNAVPSTTISGGSIVIHEVKSNAPVATKTTKLSTTTTAETSQLYNYPNTFTDRTTIAFSLEKEESYSLEVYDMRGVLIRKVDMGVAKAGKLYEYEFDGKNLSKGIYIARLLTPSGMKSVKMLLTK
ncbi:HYR domain-containing protein [Pontibacter sp. BT310]|uniref:HYR domain-containing protein n=1 Tax=Pontibacter populi TaxID=890055 RepID=A0ABS6XCE4_9BACT|nr:MULTISPECIES: HYR domain-containing protein [Pontibacter]MBJ6117908.1 HYR domain-containing protein [Pontibacter sp. BT310]MBR0570335.1 HYR domain-containing protein [Microvirga sp. STS03]MBW3364761.1 HYR domain-containing protein [Pontibacter populi]